MSNNQIPCIDCITLAICKAYILKEEPKPKKLLKIAITAQNKCSLLEQYLKVDDRKFSPYDNKKADKVIKYMMELKQ
jgi:hypothetical protein